MTRSTIPTTPTSLCFLFASSFASVYVSKWLEDYADVFGYETQSAQATPNVDPKQAAAYQRMTNAVEQGATPEFQADIHRRLMNANSREELDAVIKESGL